MFFFFKQKTAYEMRISDWSSDVCSSDLSRLLPDAHDSGRRLPAEARRLRRILRPAFARYLPPRARARRTDLPAVLPMGRRLVRRRLRHLDEIGRASCRERVCQYV